MNAGDPDRAGGSHAPQHPVVVCGAGAAGMAAALSAARQGADVWLIETADRVGGTVTGALIHTLGGLYDSRGALINHGLPSELAERLAGADASVRQRRLGRTWVLNVCPAVYRGVVEAWLAEHSRLRVLTGWRGTRVTIEGDRLVGFEVAHGCERLSLRPRAVVDATGTAEIVRLIDQRLVETDERPAAGSVIFRLRGVVPRTLDFPQGLGIVRALHSAAEQGALPAICAKAWIDAGVYDDEVFIKLFVPVPARSNRLQPVASSENGAQELTGPAEAGHYERALRVRDQVIPFLRTFHGFEGCQLTETGGLGVRDGGRTIGEYRLTVDDVRSGRRFDDAVGRCAWPIEYWDPDEGVSIEYLPEGQDYEIPLRCLAVRGFRNVWVAGKCLSAEARAQASARVVGTCWAMGEAAGRAAARAAAQE